MSKTIIYTRVSTISQSQKGISIDMQIDQVKSYLSSMNINGEVEVITDVISGSKKSRPGLDRLIELCETEDIQCVACYSYSRMSRNTTDLLSLVEFFKSQKVRFVSVKENTDTETPTGYLFLTIMSSLAQFERDQLRERVRDALAHLKANGRVLGRPRGERNIELIKELRNNGKTIKEISSLTGWSESTICRDLSRMTK